VRAAHNPDGAASTATFRAKCAMCHGSDGAGSEVGKSMNVPDLRSPVFQKLPDAQLAQIISDGKGGMPPFKSSLSEEQITRFGGIHSLATPKEIARILFNAVLQLQMSAIPSVSSRLNRGTS
jgi:mono/diheme cytochrome c family protein